MVKTVLVDVQNVVYKNYYGYKKSSDDKTVLDISICALFLDLLKYKRSENFDKLVLAFDGKKSWRRLYTKDIDSCITYKKYKGERNDKLTDKEVALKKELSKKTEDLCEGLKKYSGLICLHNDYLEADDMIAQYCELYHDKENIIIVSSDKDFLQLLYSENIEISNPYKNGKDRDLEDWNNDPQLFLFEKCIRGEGSGGDNVMSSYPRLRRTKIIEAYYDEYKKNNIMNHNFSVTVYNDELDDYEEKQFLTEEVFKENKMLMDLREGPPQEMIDLSRSIIRKEVETKRKINPIRLLRWFSKREYNVLVEDFIKYREVLENPSV